MHKISGTQVDSFTWAYLTALFWTTSEDEFPEYCYSGEFSISESDVMLLSPDTLIQIIEDCQKFCDRVEEDLGNWDGQDASFDQIDSAKAGHDFALTRNGHGTGFWDRDASVYGVTCRNNMDIIAKTFGEFNLYKGDDGQIYGS